MKTKMKSLLTIFFVVICSFTVNAFAQVHGSNNYVRTYNADGSEATLAEYDSETGKLIEFIDFNKLREEKAKIDAVTLYWKILDPNQPFFLAESHKYMLISDFLALTTEQQKDIVFNQMNKQEREEASKKVSDYRKANGLIASETTSNTN